MKITRTALPVAVALLAAATFAAPAHAVSPPSLNGVWRTDGYGTVLSIEGTRLRMYEITEISCLPSGEPFTRIGRGRDGAVTYGVGSTVMISVRPEGRDRARVDYMGDVADKGLRRLSTLPARCSRPMPKDPVTSFDVFWQTYEENYLDFAAKGVDWRATRERYRPKVNSRTDDERLFRILTQMIGPLGDAHTGIQRDERHRFIGRRPGTRLPLGGDLKPRIDRALAAYLRVPARTWGAGELAYADLPGGLGYLRVTGFGDYAGADATLDEERAELDRALDAVFTSSRVRDLRGLVIDVRYNTGGYDDLGLRIASRLTRAPYVAYTKRARNDPRDPAGRTPWQTVTVQPGRGPVYEGPVAVLTGDMTVSAGETFTMALMGRTPEPRRFGGATQGAFSDILGRTLPNGWRFGLSNEDYRTRSGRTFEGTGIPPHTRTPVFTDAELNGGRDSAMDAARAWLSGTGPVTVSP
ncbi:S41 family peptidase [Microtetraspora fusca]|uniref:S41 family peptidase n=1 Tax=Microtetraspora fusca TaxID=1997 RepID=UPI000836AF25|nr:S41 family peptidase [Microtetraspora fusca]